MEHSTKAEGVRQLIRAMVIDDERPAIKEMEFLLQQTGAVEVVGTFTNPLHALQEIADLNPAVVFLDINMPQLQGMDAASRLLDRSPDTRIVFVTAHDQYAVEAFELHALDYLLKPISPERLAKTIERLGSAGSAVRPGSDRRLCIRCMGRFHLSWPEADPIKWRTERTKELFAFMVHNAERMVSKDQLLDRLWPDDDPERAIRQLYNGIYYIRKALQEYGVGHELLSIDGSYCLRLGAVDCDLIQLRQLDVATCSIEELERMELLCAGEYLQGDDYAWAQLERERLNKKRQQCLLRLSHHYLSTGHFAEAEHRLLQAYRQDPYEERTTELLLKLYAQTGEKSKAVRHFHAYAALLQDDLGIAPAARLQRIFQSIT